MKKIKNRLIALFMSLLMMLSVLPITAFAGTYITNMNSNAEFGVISGTYSKYGHELHYANYDGKNYILFCCEYDVTSPNGSTYKYGTDFKKYLNRSGATYEKIAQYIAFGYTLQHGDGLPNTKSEWIAACCTQQFVWETLGVNPSRSSWNSEYMSDSLYKSWLSDTNELIDTYYKKKPSFNSSTKNIGLGGNTTLTDSNGVFKYYPTFSKTVNKVMFEHTKGKNTLTISVDDDCSDSSVSFNSASQGIYMDLPTGASYDKPTMNYCYFDFDSGSIQDLMFSNYVDPQTFLINISISSGSIGLTKQSEDGIVGGVSFTATGNGKTYSLTTNSSGVASLSGLPLYDDDNNAITYTVRENNVPVRYVIPESQTIAPNGNGDSSLTFKNVLKKFRVTVTKEDIEMGIAQGDAKLSGAVYGLYNDGQLVDEFTTDVNGQFTTGYYICGDNWYLKEISPSEGYLLDENTYHVGAEAKNYTVELNSTSNTVKEQVIKGNISIIKHTDDGTTKIETPEKGATFQIYLKSSGSYANAKPTEKDTIVCDEDGFASSKLLPYGTYTVHQTKGWEGREKIADFDVFIKTDGMTYKFLINNANFYSYLKVVKLDKETNKQIPFEGAGFEIYDADGHRVTMQYTYPQVTSIHTFYTNSNGYLITPEKLPYGDYTLVEVQAPHGYVLDKTPVPFSINQENSSTDTGVTVVKVKAYGMAQRGVINITKIGEVFASASNENDIYTPIYELQNLSNATFQIYAAEDIVTPDGTTRAYMGELVDEVTTGKDGAAKSKELYLGKYTIIEKTAPNTFVNLGKQYDVELTYAGQNISVTDDSVTVRNERQKVFISLSKIMEKNCIYNIGNNGEIKVVSFGIFTNEDVVASDGTTIPKDSLVCIANCDDNGKLLFTCDLPIGFKWYAKEIATDVHYIMSDERYEFDTEYKGQDIQQVDIAINDGKDIVNELKYGKVSGVKVDDSNEPLSGALIGIFNKNIKEFIEDNAIQTIISADDGSFSFENVPYGEWVIREIAAPKGYVLDSNSYDVNINDNDVTVEISIINKLIRGSIVIHKTDASTGKAIPNVGFRIYDKDKNIIAEGVTDKNGNCTFENLVYGDYFYQEYSCDDKYILDDELYPFSISEDGQVIKAEMKNELKPVTPKTGDDSDRRTLITILCACAFIILCILHRCPCRKKSTDSEDDLDEDDLDDDC